METNNNKEAIDIQKIILATFGSCLIVLPVISAFFFNQGLLIGFYLLSLAIGSAILFTINKKFREETKKPTPQQIQQQVTLLVNIRKLLLLVLFLNVAYIFLTTFLVTGYLQEAIVGDVGILVFIVQLIIIPILLALIVITWRVMDKKEKITYILSTTLSSAFIVLLVAFLNKYA